jgi:hypothetical protein
MLMAGLSTRRPEFDSRRAYVEFEVDKLELRHSWKNYSTLIYCWERFVSRGNISIHFKGVFFDASYSKFTITYSVVKAIPLQVWAGQ